MAREGPGQVGNSQNNASSQASPADNGPDGPYRRMEGASIGAAVVVVGILAPEPDAHPRSSQEPPNPSRESLSRRCTR
ncbi:hypothetical protein TREES_T100015658 [Tupaia chinensis]|uniref:Uncharacterized protein n=1 Tax=Tupaia chinensis TaxID=246437 RepID=L9L8I6_TUPCH|nr:hypothetical protein TREES_T100015658 [Tupaia chinensis]